jgi:predicted nucleic acid-binding protein
MVSFSACLVDTNVLARSIRRADPSFELVSNSLRKLVSERVRLKYTHQNIANSETLMTRPVASNELALSHDRALCEVHEIQSNVALLPDSKAAFHEWLRIVARYEVSGVQVRDARLAASMYVHRVPHILMLNVSDFSRFEGLVPVHPKDV